MRRSPEGPTVATSFGARFGPPGDAVLHTTRRASHLWRTCCKPDGLVTPAATSRGIVLVADDDVDFRAALTTLLEWDGFLVVNASSGAQALQAARSSDPDVVLLDQRMPEMSGLEVRAALRASGYGRTIVLVTAAEEVLTSPDEPHPLDRVLMKPFDIDELIAIVRRAAAEDRAPWRREDREGQDGHDDGPAWGERR